MTYRHYRIPGGYVKPGFQVNRLARYALPSNYYNPAEGGLAGAVVGRPAQLLYSWQPEILETPPASFNFASSGAQTVSTTTDGVTFWDQTTKSGEIRYPGSRRVYNLVSVEDLTVSTSRGSNTSVTTAGVNDNGAPAFRLEIVDAGSGSYLDIPTSEIDLSGETVCLRVRAKQRTGSSDSSFRFLFNGSAAGPTITVGTDWADYCHIAQSEGDGLYGIDNMPAQLLDIEISELSLSIVQTGQTKPDPYVNPSDTLISGVSGVLVDNLTNANSVDVNGVITEAVGTTITGGGLLIEDVDSASLTGWVASAPYSVVIDVTAPDTLASENRILSLQTAGSNDLSSDASGNVSLAADDNLSIVLAETVSAGDRDKFALTYRTDASDLSGSGFTAGNDSSISVNANAIGDIILGGAGPVIIHSIKVYGAPGLTATERESAVGN